MYAPGSVVLQFVLLLESPTVWTGEMPPDANPLESDIVTRNLLPLGKGIWVWKLPLLLLKFPDGTSTVRGVPNSYMNRMNIEEDAYILPRYDSQG